MPIIVKDLQFIYNPKTPFAVCALKDLSVSIADGEIVGIIGHTGSGKSTFVQHLNALIRVQSGSIVIDGIDLSPKKTDLKKIRSTVGMVFQYPEYQLFADTVEKDVAFGCVNAKLSKEETDKRVKDALQMVGLDYETVKDKSPFDLSGGEKRRVALAGVIVMQPSVLVLDEPTAGLDPQGKRSILSLVRRLNTERGVTVLIVSHDMNEIYENVDRVLLFDNGTIVKDLPTEEMFLQDMSALGLELPAMATVKNMLAKQGVTITGRTVEEVESSIMQYFKGVRNV